MQAFKKYSHGGTHTDFTGPKGDDMSDQEKAVEGILQSMTLQSDDKKRDQLGIMDLMNIIGARGSNRFNKVNPYEPGTAEYSFFEDPSLKEQFPEEYAKLKISDNPTPKNLIPYRDDDGNLKYKVLKTIDRKGRGRYQDVSQLTIQQIQDATSVELSANQLKNVEQFLRNPRFKVNVADYLFNLDEEEPDVKKFKPRIARNVGRRGIAGGGASTGGAGSRSLRKAQGGGIANWFKGFCDRMSRHPSCR